MYLKSNTFTAARKGDNHPQVDKIKRVGGSSAWNISRKCNSGLLSQLTPHTISLKIFVSNVFGVE